MDKYICRICGEIYDPEAGDPDHSIEPGTSFDQITHDWQCPTCQSNKGEFELYSE